MYRKDCNLAAQLLQCNKSLYMAQLSEVSCALTFTGLIFPVLFILCKNAFCICSSVLVRPQSSGSLSSQKSHTTKLKNCMSFRLFCADIWCEPRKTEKSVIFQFSGSQVKEKALVKAKGEERSEWGVSWAALSWIFSWWHEMSKEKFAVLTVTWRSSCPLWARKDKSSRSDEYCRSLEEGQKVKN